MGTIFLVIGERVKRARHSGLFNLESQIYQKWNVRKYCTECTVTVITCLVVAKELFILCALFIPPSHHSSFSLSFMPCSYL